MPVAYLLNICAQQLGTVPASDITEAESKSAWEQVCRLSTALLAVYDVQSYTVFEDLFHDARTLIDFLRSRAVYDSGVSISQLRPSDLLPFLAGVFDWVDQSKLQAEKGWTLSGALVVIKTIIGKAAHNRGPVLLNVEELRRKCSSLPNDEFEAVVAMLTHDQSVNQNFRLPNDVTSTDFWRKPLVRMASGVVLLMDARGCGPAFYEAIAAVTRSIWGEDSENQIGKAAERFVNQTLRSHGIKSVAGRYQVKEISGECDSIVETSHLVIFAELKKKALTRAAKAGTDINLIVDLAASLLAAYLQAAGHEILIRELGRLDLENDTGQWAVSLAGRDVETVVLSLLDFGSLNDRNLMMQFLRSFLQASFRPREAKHVGQFDEIEEQREELVQQYSKLATLEPRYAKQPFFNSWFLSIPQLLVLLDVVTSPDEFEASLRSTKYIETGSGDFCFDLAQMTKLRVENS